MDLSDTGSNLNAPRDPLGNVPIVECLSIDAPPLLWGPLLHCRWEGRVHESCSLVSAGLTILGLVSGRASDNRDGGF